MVVSRSYADDQEPATHADGTPGAAQRVWGFETTFGGMTHYAVVRVGRLGPSPPP